MIVGSALIGRGRGLACRWNPEFTRAGCVACAAARCSEFQARAGRGHQSRRHPSRSVWLCRGANSVAGCSLGGIPQYRAARISWKSTRKGARRPARPAPRRPRLARSPIRSQTGTLKLVCGYSAAGLRGSGVGASRLGISANSFSGQPILRRRRLSPVSQSTTTVSARLVVRHLARRHWAPWHTSCFSRPINPSSRSGCIHIWRLPPLHCSVLGSVMLIARTASRSRSYPLASVRCCSRICRRRCASPSKSCGRYGFAKAKRNGRRPGADVYSDVRIGGHAIQFLRAWLQRSIS